VQVVGFVSWSKRRDEGAGLVCRVPEGAVEPDADLPGELECCERGAVISDQRVAGGVACPPDFTEELGNLARKDTLILQSADKLILGLLRRHIGTDIRRDMLREQLGQLAQLEQRGIRVLREIPFREQPQAQELLVVLRELGEVGLDGCHLCGPLMIGTCYLTQAATYHRCRRQCYRARPPQPCTELLLYEGHTKIWRC